MIVWLWANVILTILALAFASFNGKSPHRLRFSVCFAALFSWMIPWDQVARFVPVAPAIPYLLPNGVDFDVGSRLSPAVSDPATAGWMATIAANAEIVFLALTVVGALLFVYSSLRYVRFVGRLSVGSVSGSNLWTYMPWEMVGSRVPKRKPELRIQRHVAGAVTTGILVPKIWVHENLVEDPDLTAALVHEYRHVKNFDNAYLWVITLIEKLFWWNPLVRYLSSRTRRLQELSCDEACANELNGYRDMLSRLVLASSDATARSCPQTSCIHHSKNFNVQRLRALEKRYIMKTRHYISTGLLLVGSSISLSWVLAQDATEEQSPSIGCVREPNSPSPSIEQRLELIQACTGVDHGPITGFEPGTTLEQAERLYRDMKLYASLVDHQFDQQEELIESLKEELEALKDEPQLVENR